MRTVPHAALRSLRRRRAALLVVSADNLRSDTEQDVAALLKARQLAHVLVVPLVARLARPVLRAVLVLVRMQVCVVERTRITAHGMLGSTARICAALARVLLSETSPARLTDLSDRELPYIGTCIVSA